MKTKYGRMECLTPGCGHQVVVKQNENGTLSYSCDECDGSGYAKKGQGVHDVWVKRITPAAAKEKPAVKPEEKPAPAAAPKKPASTLV